ncbi:somatomedin-B and thrombospondin type-1 domain-containing protein [Solenopsis invicta]|uniref:somatomedin-B and thrombospondin type-1 domain-containing protein n=1 Tax=Solenopsis invicta TaxID=13686 RepID=UPI000596205D|nr:somatomedin-B and thrombospondin type-1 domain-containing protein [Solenopsis invicta]XP_011162614.1 somatomedin-B and thrombospondin type-1 domain-containing protein [Solenopsis invicta]XP_039310063.1 somatomedin-B and thrombospondin type-1 domain-containing protein [Solenopsis invicta]
MWRKDATRLARLIVVATLISLTVDGTAAGSCSSAKLCCQGRDSGCVIQKESNEIPSVDKRAIRDKPCYCDHACLKLADCCDDFKETCGVVDCAVSEWSPWTPCDNGCGSGTQRRSRVIEIEEKNGGKHCPHLDQVRTCRSFEKCHARIRSQPHAKSVMLLALSPSDGNSTDVRIKNRIVDKRGSCIPFTILWVSRGCRKFSSLLSQGSWICVERPGNDSLDKYVGIGKWKLSTDIAGGNNRHGRSIYSTCHGRWVGDSPVDCHDDLRCFGYTSQLVDCRDDSRCVYNPRFESSLTTPYTTQTVRSRRGANSNVVSNRVVRRRRKGRRWKRSRRRRRAVAVTER